MSIHLVTDEAAIRRQLYEAANRIRTALAACPPVDDLEFGDTEQVCRSIDDATNRLREAEGLTAELEALRDASGEAVVLVATSRAALRIVDEVLCTFTAALDAASAAA